MMTVDALKDRNKKDLARLAKDRGIIGWHAMRKDQLLRALAALSSKKDKHPEPRARHAKPAPASPRPRPAARPAAKPPIAVKSASRRSSRRGEPASPPSILSRPVPVNAPRELGHDCVKDRVVVMVRDPFWLHAHWELSRATLARAQAALGQEWHAARPILRLMDVTSEDTTSVSERHVRDIDIHGGVNNWYIDVVNPPRSYRVDLGYLGRRGKFFVLARSNVVATPKAGVSDVMDENWSNMEHSFARIFRQSNGGANGNAPSEDLKNLFEERLRRPMHSLSLQSLGTGALGSLGRGFHFEIDAELIVYGATEPNAQVTLQGEPVPLRPDGTFTVRFSLPDSRQIIPAVAASPDGAEERTIVLAVERNTKELEPMIHDGNEL